MCTIILQVYMWKYNKLRYSSLVKKVLLHLLSSISRIQILYNCMFDHSKLVYLFRVTIIWCDSWSDVTDVLYMFRLIAMKFGTLYIPMVTWHVVDWSYSKPEFVFSEYSYSISTTAYYLWNTTIIKMNANVWWQETNRWDVYQTNPGPKISNRSMVATKYPGGLWDWIA